MKKIIIGLVILLQFSCSDMKLKTLENDFYRVVLTVQNNEKLPFVMKVKSLKEIEIYNAEEIIEVDEITYRNDSVFIHPPVFEGYIAAKITEKGFEGAFIKESLDRIVPLVAEKGIHQRFKIKNSLEVVDISGVWEVTFSGGTDDDTWKGKGIFKQNGNQLTGTFRTLTGDYRYLEGIVDGGSFKLSVFDGAHAFLFSGNIESDNLSGVYYSDKHWNKNFTAIRNPNYALPGSEGLTYLREGYSKFEFSFPNMDDEIISTNDDTFKNKVTIIQIMGTWCPNCLDESKFLTQYINENQFSDLEVVALAFEQAKTKQKAKGRIKRLKERIKISYPILLAQYGGSNKNIANEKLPMLNHILSYPTTIFIDKKGNIRKIHTGFNGPATGKKFLDFKTDFQHFIQLLRSE